MSSALMKSFKEKINANKDNKDSIKVLCQSGHNVFVKINNEILACIDRKTISASADEVKEQIEEVFNQKKKFARNEIIPVSTFSDCMFDIKCLERQEDKIYFELC